jgi:guanylate kinase
MEACFEQVHGLLRADRLRRARQTGLVDFTRFLMR